MNNMDNMSGFIADDEDLNDHPPKDLKIANKIIKCNLEKCINGTSEYIPNFQNNLIKDVEFNEKNIHKRIFYKKFIDVGYIEVFLDPSLAFSHKICENITFLFECKAKDQTSFDEKRCFGFRYYNKLKSKYCTLLKENDENEDDYFFLENQKN